MFENPCCIQIGKTKIRICSSPKLSKNGKSEIHAYSLVEKFHFVGTFDESTFDNQITQDLIFKTFREKMDEAKKTRFIAYNAQLQDSLSEEFISEYLGEHTMYLIFLIFGKFKIPLKRMEFNETNVRLIETSIQNLKVTKKFQEKFQNDAAQKYIIPFLAKKDEEINLENEKKNEKWKKIEMESEANSQKIKSIQGASLKLLKNLCFPGGSMLTPNEVISITKWIGYSFKGTLVFKAKVDGFDQFHTKCDQKENLIFLFKTKDGRKFGAFSSEKWASSSNYIVDNQAFLFSLDHNKKIESLKNGSSLYDHPGLGPTFGGHDLYITLNCNTNGDSNSNLGLNYVDTTGSGRDSEKSKSYLTGNFNFVMDDYEVFQVLKTDDPMVEFAHSVSQ
jgi:hypothetical protein